MMKKCTKCNEVKPLTEFHRRAASNDGLEYKCKSCVSKYYSTYLKRSGFEQRNRQTHLFRTYNITSELYENLLEQQNQSCALCGKHKSEFKRRLAVDHDHTCCPGSRSCGRCIRGLLCAPCNTFLGKVESGVVTIEQIETYRTRSVCTIAASTL